MSDDFDVLVLAGRLSLTSMAAERDQHAPAHAETDRRVQAMRDARAGR